MIEINEVVAKKVLEVVDVGLVCGIGNPTPGSMCVEAAVCYALGLPHGDDPQCVAPSLRKLKIRLNDSPWLSKKSRAKGLRRLAVAQLGSFGTLNEVEFATRVLRMTIQVAIPYWFRLAAKKCPKKADVFNTHADICEKEPTRENMLKASTAAAYAAAAYADAYGADAYAAAYAAAAYAYAAADADAYAAAGADAAYADLILHIFAEEVVKILIDMKVPGCVWLPLTE